MNVSASFVHDGEQLVTASDLVRAFGIWQDRATRAPVYILHRGRPRLVLTSIEMMDALCAPHAGREPDAAAELTSLLDGMREIVLLIDPAGKIIAASREAQRHFGASASAGSPVAGLGSDDGALLATAVERVAGAGVAEAMEIVSARRPGRRLSLAIEPTAQGVAVFARDVTTAEALHDLTATREACGAAAAATGRVAEVSINLRGHCESPGAALAAMTGVSAAALATPRFVTLFDVASRVVLGEAIERTIAEGMPQAVDVELLVNRAPNRPVRVGLAPRRRGAAVEGVYGMIVVA